MTTPEDLSDDPKALRAKAVRYRELALGIMDPKAIGALLELADNTMLLPVSLSGDAPVAHSQFEPAHIARSTPSRLAVSRT
jgi:hypothetical protein